MFVRSSTVERPGFYRLVSSEITANVQIRSGLSCFLPQPVPNSPLMVGIRTVWWGQSAGVQSLSQTVRLFT